MTAVEMDTGNKKNLKMEGRHPPTLRPHVCARVPSFTRTPPARAVKVSKRAGGWQDAARVRQRIAPLPCSASEGRKGPPMAMCVAGSWTGVQLPGIAGDHLRNLGRAGAPGRETRPRRVVVATNRRMDSLARAGNGRVGKTSGEPCRGTGSAKALAEGTLRAR
jgi:hypothetical protein